MKEKEKRRGRGRRRREEEEEGIKPKRYGNYLEYGTLDFCMELTLDMNSSMNHMGFYGILEKFMSSKPRVLLGFYPNPIIMESKLGKTLNRTRIIIESSPLGWIHG